MIFQPKNMLVTGGAGFIGSHFIRYILNTDQNINVINLDKLTYAASLDNLENLNGAERYEFVHGDITDIKLVNDLLKSFNIETIVHFAAESHVDRSISEPSSFISTNVVGSYALLEAARLHWLNNNQWDKHQCRFHHISTDEVFGALNISDAPFKESSRYQPNSPYSATKAGSDHLVNAYHHTYQLPITISNCSNNYGPYQHPEKFIPTIIRNALLQQSIPIYGNGKQIRDWLHVEDHCRGIDLVLRKGKIGESYNIGGDNEWENLELAKMICKRLDHFKPENAPHEKFLTFVTDRKGHDFRYAINHHKITNELGWQCTQDFSAGIDETIRFISLRLP